MISIVGGINQMAGPLKSSMIDMFGTINVTNVGFGLSSLPVTTTITPIRCTLTVSARTNILLQRSCTPIARKFISNLKHGARLCLPDQTSMDALPMSQPYLRADASEAV